MSNSCYSFLSRQGASDFFCKFCSEELSNVYMHCDGCEKLLNKDFNICSNCHQEGRYKVKVLMHPFNEKPHSILNHTGNPQHLNQSRCPCKNGKACQFCSYCTGCSCRCHQSFTLHYRFMEMSNELEILKNVENIVGSDTISHTAETKARLLSLMSDDLPLVDTAVQQPHKEEMICQIIDVPKKEEKPTEQVQQQPQLPKKIEAKPPPGTEEKPPKKEVQSTDQQSQKQPKKQRKKIDAKHPTPSEKKKSKASIPPKESRTPAPEFGPGWTKYKVPRKNNKNSYSHAPDQYYVSPKGERFRSKSEVERYLHPPSPVSLRGKTSAIDESAAKQPEYKIPRKIKNNPNGDGKVPPAPPPAEKKIVLHEGTKTTPTIDESAAKQPAESHNIKNEVDKARQMNGQKDIKAHPGRLKEEGSGKGEEKDKNEDKAQPGRLKEEGEILVNGKGDEDEPLIMMSTKRKRSDSGSSKAQRRSSAKSTKADGKPTASISDGGRVSLEVAANSGCTKCKKELESGVKHNNVSHSNQCPRKMCGKKARSTTAARGTLPDTTQVKQQKKRPRQDDNSHSISEGRKLRSMSDSSSALSNSARPDMVHSSAQFASFHCDKCDKDIKFSNVKTAGEEFANHVKECEDSKTRNKKRMRRSSRSLTRDNSMSSLSTNSLPGPLPDEVASRSRVTRGRSVQFTIGQHVLVWCEKTNDHWKATILNRKEKNGIPGYNIHYKGAKWKSGKSTRDWAPEEDITASAWE